MKTPRSSTATIIAAMEILSRDIQSDDGVANAAIAEAAQRLREMALALGHDVDEPGRSSSDQMRQELTAIINS